VNSFKSWRSLLVKRIYITTGVVFFFLSYELSQILDVAIIDSYFVIPGTWLYVFIGIVYLFFGSIQWKFERSIRPLNPIIIWSHYGVTTLTLCLVLFTNVTALINAMIFLMLAVQVIYVLTLCNSLFVIVRDAFRSN
jgi:hypothetical protein